jgi:hypothetical protein
VSDRFEAEAVHLARVVLRLTFVILSAVGFAVSVLLIALAFAIERLYSVPALPWALATLALPASGLVALACSTRLAHFIGRTPAMSPPQAASATVAASVTASTQQAPTAAAHRTEE